jgi:hypothetical protein
MDRKLPKYSHIVCVPDWAKTGVVVHHATRGLGNTDETSAFEFQFVISVASGSNIIRLEDRSVCSVHVDKFCRAEKALTGSVVRRQVRVRRVRVESYDIHRLNRRAGPATSRCSFAICIDLECKDCLINI